MAAANEPLREPVLQRPGAGLPWWEWLAAKYFLFPRACRRLSWADSDRMFQDEGARILALWDQWPAGRLGERVLIRRIRGIEDSSRFWSAAMTVEHLIIVGTAVRQVISSLRRGEVPAREARVEEVKPQREPAPDEMRAGFVRLLDEARAAEAPLAAGTGPRYRHPWLGPIGAFEWHCLLGVHQGIHRKQMEAIRAGLTET